MSVAPRVYKPETPILAFPFMVKVLPEPVWPYAKQVTFAPWKAESTSGLTAL